MCAEYQSPVTVKSAAEVQADLEAKIKADLEKATRHWSWIASYPNDMASLLSRYTHNYHTSGVSERDRYLHIAAVALAKVRLLDKKA